MHFIITEAQAQKWKAHNMNSIGWGLFVVNNNLYVDLVNTQMLRCIIYKSQQIVGNILNQSFIPKGFIKCSNANGVTPMKTHVDFAHSCSVAKRKLILVEKFMVKHVDLYHSWQLKKKSARTFGLIIMTVFGFTNLYKHGDEPQ